MKCPGSDGRQAFLSAPRLAALNALLPPSILTDNAEFDVFTACEVTRPVGQREPTEVMVLMDWSASTKQARVRLRPVRSSPSTNIFAAILLSIAA